MVTVASGYLADDGLFAGTAASLLRRVDTLAAHVGLEIPKHRIQLVLLEELAFPRELLILMGRVSLSNVNARLRAFNGG